MTRRPGRSGWDSPNRRTTLINLGFAGAIVVSILILVGYAGYSWYNTHFGAAATVNGAVITNDDVRERAKIVTFQLQYAEAQVKAEFNAGRITSDVENQQIQSLDQELQQVSSLAVETLIDATLQAKLAADDGLTASDADIDAQVTKESTSVEERHVFMIEVEPATDPSTGQVGQAQKDAAKQKADDALAQLKGGKAWDDVAKTVSTAATAPQAGDVGWLSKDVGYDAKFMDAVFALQPNSITDVILGDDGTYRIGRVTDIAPATLDTAFQTKLEAAGISLDEYRVAAKADVLRQKLEDKVVADLSAPSLQRHVLQIKLTAITPDPTAVKVRHILFAPKHDAANASKLDQNDPAWQVAHDAAEAAYRELLADTSLFDQMARSDINDDAAARAQGGKLSWYNPDSQIDAEFGKQIFAPGLRPGQILAPFRTTFGWDLVQFQRPYGDGNQAWLQGLKQEIDSGQADFGQVARDQGEGDEAAKGGDIGWVAKGQLGDTQEAAIFAATVGKTTDVIDVPNDGDYLYKVIAEQMMPASPEQVAIFKDSGFTNWYNQKKDEATITRATDSSTTSG